MFVSSIEVLPEEYKLKKVLGVVVETVNYEVTKKTLWRSMNGSSSAEADPVGRGIRGLKEYAREMGANGVIGIKITTCTQGFSNGSYMYMTFTGTAVVLETP